MRIILVLLAALFLSTVAMAATPEEDVERYVRIFEGDKSAHSDAANTFAWMGLSDPRVFDIIERRLLADQAVARGDRDDKNRVARYIRALGFSGQPKYQPTINSFVKDPVYNRYAEAALGDLAEYQKWNPIISNRATFDPKLSDDANRVINMLRADDLLLKRVGAKRVYFAHKEPEVLAVLAKELQANYSNRTREYADSIAWMLKALGSARDEKYRPMLEDIASQTAGGKVGSHARKALEYYSKPR